MVLFRVLCNLPKSIWRKNIRYWQKNSWIFTLRLLHTNYVHSSKTRLWIVVYRLAKKSEKSWNHMLSEIIFKWSDSHTYCEAWNVSRKRGIIFISDVMKSNCWRAKDFCFHDYKLSFQIALNYFVHSARRFDLHNFQNFCLKYFRQVWVFDLVAVTSKSCATRTVVEHSVIERCFDGFSSFR